MRYRDSLACDFDQTFPYLSNALVGDAHRSKLRSLGCDLPSMDGGFESHLTGDGPSADISLRCTPCEPVARIICGDHPSVRLPEPMRAQSCWRHAASAVDTLAPDGHLWFEYDDADLGARFPTPNLIVVSGKTERQNSPAGLAARLTLLGHDDADPASLNAVRSVLARLPAGAGVLEVGIMGARAGRPLRLRLGGLSPADLDALALTLGWPESSSRRRTLRGLAALYPELAVVLDFSNGCLLRFGVPMPCNEYPNEQRHHPVTTAALSWLLMQGLCAPAAAIGIRDWFGWSEDIRKPGDYPYDFPEPAPPDHVGVLMRVVVQFKLVFDIKGEKSAKAYYGYLRRQAPRNVAGAPPLGPRLENLAAA